MTPEDKAYMDQKFATLKESLTEEIREQIRQEFRSDLDAMKTSLDELKLTISGQKAEISSLRRQLAEKDAVIANQAVSHDDLEQYGRRYAIRVDNLPYNDDKETDAQLCNALDEEFAKANIRIDFENDVQRLHRVGKPKTLKDSNQVVRQVIVKFTRWSAREKFGGFNKTAKQKRIQIRVSHDLTQRRLRLLNLARDKISANMQRLGYTEDQIRGKNGQSIPDEFNVFAYANYNSELRIRGRKTVFKFNTETELNKVMEDLFNNWQLQPRRVCARDILDIRQWKRDPEHVFGARGPHSEGYGNPYRLSDHSREECLKLYREKVVMSTSELDKIRLAKEVACYCPLDVNCHVDILIERAMSRPPTMER